MPNERSSHTVPTPSGAGLAIACVFLGVVLFFGIANILDRSVAWALAGGGSLVAAVGWIDVHYTLKARYRIVVQIVAAIFAIWSLNGMPSIDLGFMRLSLGIGGSLLAVLVIVWMSNLYNFMDGIDGLIGAETIVVGFVGGAFLASAGAWDLAYISWILAISAAGFLVWNWHPAKIFMGDVGSVLIGFSFAVIVIASENKGSIPIVGWIILLAMFIADATLSTLRRVLRGERWFMAHRTFSYQRAVQMGYRHDQVVIRAMGISSVLAGIMYLGWKLFPQLLLLEAFVVFLLLTWGWLILQRRFPLN